MNQLNSTENLGNMTEGYLKSYKFSYLFDLNT